MNVRRGDVVLVLSPFASGRGASRRPALIVQITTNVRRAREPTQRLIERSTLEGQQAGLLHDSAVSCNNLATVHEDRINRVIGHLPDPLMPSIDECLKTAL